MGITNSQFFDAMMGGTVYRIDAADGALTGKSYDRIYVAADVVLTTLTGTGSVNLLTAMNVTSDTDVLHAGLIFGAGQGKKITAITVKAADTGVVYGITFGTTSV
jgi:hypothetical protein